MDGGSLRTCVLKVAVSAAQFGTVSVIAASVDVAVFSTLIALTRLPPAGVNPFSFGCGFVAGFALNRFWVFRRSGGDPSVQLVKFAAVNAASLVISTIAVGALAMMMPAIAAKLLSLPITFGWNFVMSRSWVFRRQKLPQPHPAD
jgi:putative flippase GtrA